MTTVLKISGYSLEFDPHETRKAYASQLATCECLHCRNFYPASSAIPDALVEFLDHLGIPPANPVYISQICENPDGSHLYSLSYDVIGRVTSAPTAEAGAAHLGIPIDIPQLPQGVTARIALEPYVPGHFPQPLVEFEFILNLPWVLDTQPAH